MPPTFQDNQSIEAARMLAYGKSLYDLHRYKDAEANLRQCLARDPRNWSGHYYLGASLLAQSESRLEKARDGLKEAQRAVALQPDTAAGYFLLSWAHLCCGKPKDALDAVHQGMRIDPQEPWGYSLAAMGYRSQRSWLKVLQAASTGLKIDPEYISLLNLSAEALVMLGRKEEARAAVMEALRCDPASPKAHANRGWLALYDGQEKEALFQFREAMRLDPTSESARAGLVQALHARNPLYRLLLGYFLWTRRVSTAEFWGAMALVTGFNTAVRVMVRAFPPLLIIALPYFALYQVFTFFTWTGDAFFNLLLRLSPSGRLVLSKDEQAAGMGCGFTGILFLINITALITALLLRPGSWSLAWAFLLGALLSVGMMIPVAGIYKADPFARSRRAVLAVLAVLLGASAACAWGASLALSPWQILPLALFLTGWMVYPWVANLILSIQED
jgi:tetratricopeptide (TPR) repeat protein